MANTKLRCICFLLAISYGLSDRFVGGRKGTIKTIEGKNGGVIDCVDIYQQPAFNHPLLKNHIIEMKPSSTPNVTKGEFYDIGEIFQGLLEIGECPEGTIPVRHAPGDEDYISHRAIPLVPHRKNLNIIDNPTIHHEYAILILTGDAYQGAQGFINLWKPATNPGEASIAKMWLISGPSDNRKVIEAGWMVNPRDGVEPMFFIRWTNDGYKKTGCYNLDCPGFVQVSQKFALGSSIKPVSSYNGKQYELWVSIFKTPANGYWWLQVQDEPIGYWPSTLFGDLAFTTTQVAWGGEIYDLRKRRSHTTTQMGSGYFSSEGFGKASYFRNIEFKNGTGKFFEPDKKDLVPYVSDPLCYNLSVANDEKVRYGTHFYFGGPGLSEKCP